MSSHEKENYADYIAHILKLHELKINLRKWHKIQLPEKQMFVLPTFKLRKISCEYFEYVTSTSNINRN